MKVVRQADVDWENQLHAIEDRGSQDMSRVEASVQTILRDVRARGDEAVLSACEQFEGRRPNPLCFPLADIGAQALQAIQPEARAVLERAADRIRSFHLHQRESGFQYRDGGTLLGTRVRPLKRAGVYAPGGKARYPSSVLMAAIPAQVAGVSQIVLATPLGGNADDHLILAAAHLAGVGFVLNAGGAQAIGAMAYGIQSMPRTDIVVGPGNIYVACAKRLVSGVVRIDGIAGPSEILVLADDSANPAHVAADLLSQAEHDEAAYPLLATSDSTVLAAVLREVSAQLETLPRKAIAAPSVRNQGVAFLVDSREAMAEVAERIAAEHLALHVREPFALLDEISSAGAAFVGGTTPEACGDYLAGPSHVLPTGGAVRFGAPLGVYDFYRRTSVVQYSLDALTEQGPAIAAFARLEGLEAHARAVEIRLKS